MNKAKELQKELNGLRLESVRKTMTIQNKDKEIEKWKVVVIDTANERDISIDKLNKLWQKRFEWLHTEMSFATFIEYLKPKQIKELGDLITKAQNKNFEGENNAKND